MQEEGEECLELEVVLIFDTHTHISGLSTLFVYHQLSSDA